MGRPNRTAVPGAPTEHRENDCAPGTTVAPTRRARFRSVFKKPRRYGIADDRPGFSSIGW